MIKMKNIFILIIFLSTSAIYAGKQSQSNNDEVELLELATPAKDKGQYTSPSFTEPAEPNSSQSREIKESETPFGRASKSIHQQLQESVAELNNLREKVAEEKVPLSRKLNELESELINVRHEYQQSSRLLDSRTLDLSNLQSEIKSRKQESSFLSNLLSQYISKFETRLHIAELQRYREDLKEAKLAPENSNLSKREIYEAQSLLLSLSLDRLEEALGGARFDGTSTDSSGSIHHGTFALIGPAALFQSDDGQNIGTAEQRLGSLEPTVIPFADPVDSQAAAKVVSKGEGLFPCDTTLGNAHKIEETHQTLLEHIKQGGPVMYPIFALAGLALLVAILKWLNMVSIRKPSKTSINELLEAVYNQDDKAARQRAARIRGPVGKMLAVGAEHLKEPRELIEEVMYEKVLATRLKLQRFLPFIAITAASAPLLGLLGTVTGIINTFKLITVFGSGDVKTLSGGISEALITTEFGLIVAIPSLLIHALLSRKARGVVNQMEEAAVSLVNQVSKSPYRESDETNVLEKLSSAEMQNLLRRLGGTDQISSSEAMRVYSENSAGGLMKKGVFTVSQGDTVAEALEKIRKAELGDEVEAVFAVDEKGKYAGNVLIRHLLIKSELVPLGSLADKESPYVRVDTPKDEVQDVLDRHGLVHVPVLDDNDKLVGYIPRNGNLTGDENE